MMIQEASEYITKSMNYVSSPKTSCMEGNTQKTKKETITREKMHSCAPGVNYAPPGHFPFALICTKKHICVPRVWSGSPVVC